MFQLVANVVMVFFIFSMSYAELYPFPKEGKWGYINASGMIVVHPIYESAGFFIDNVAKIAHINERGEYLYGFIDETGREVVAPKFTQVSDFSGGLAYVKLKNKFAYVLKNGTVITKDLYDKIYPSINGMSLFLKDGLYGYADETGNVVIESQFNRAFNFTKDHRAKVSPSGGRKPGFGFIDPQGVFCIPAVYECARNFSEGFVGVKSGKDWIFLDKNGEQLGQRVFEDVGDFSDGLAKVKLRGFWGCINTLGELVIPPLYKEFDQFSKGLAVIGNGEYYGYIDKMGREVAPFLFTRVTRFDGKLARVSKDINHGFMNASGRHNLTDKIAWIGPCKNGRYRMRVGQYYGYYDKNAKLVIKPVYLYASDFREDLAITVSPITGGYRVAYINKSGSIVKEWNVLANMVPQNKDLLYAIVYPELPFYKESDPESRIMVNAKYGDMFIKTFQRIATPIIGHGLKGLLYSVEYYNRPGFIFSEGVSVFSPPKIGMGIYAYFREKFGIISETSSPYLYNGPMNTTFFNGATLRRTVNKNIVEDLYFVPFMKLGESLFLFAAALGYPILEYPSHSIMLPNHFSQLDTAKFVGRNNSDQDPMEYYVYIGKTKLHVSKNDAYGIFLTHTYPKPDSMPVVTDMKDIIFVTTVKESEIKTDYPSPVLNNTIQMPPIIDNVNNTATPSKSHIDPTQDIYISLPENTI